METHENDIYDKLVDYLSGSLTIKEIKKIEQKLQVDANWQQTLKKVKQFWDYKSTPAEETECQNDWNQFLKLQRGQSNLIKINFRKIGWVAAACIFIGFALVSVLYLVKNQTFQSISSNVCYLVDTLPDESIVYLSPHTTIQYKFDPAKDNCYEMSIEGEAFFAINPETRKKFVIDAGETKVTVTGTVFKVRAPTNQKPVTVSVESGSVKLTKKGSHQILLVQAGEEAVYNPQNNEMSKQPKSDAIYLIYQPSGIR